MKRYEHEEGIAATDVAKAMSVKKERKKRKKADDVERPHAGRGATL
jgi:hypothetical protein